MKGKKIKKRKLKYRRKGNQENEEESKKKQ